MKSNPLAMKSYVLAIIVLLSTSASFAQKIERVEPPNWWVGMEHNTVEVLLYGKDLAGLSVETSYSGITIHEVSTVESPNYLFVTISISENTQPGKVPFVLREGKRKKASFDYELFERAENAKWIKGFDASDAMYLITPDRFANGNPDNDIIKGMREEKIDREFRGGRHGGDLTGIRNALPYIADLGFTSVWICPVLENDMDRYSYHGYAITDLYKVDARMGSNEEYKLMTEEARELGIKIVSDNVLNHIGLEHWWMKDLPQRDWINQWEEFVVTNHKKTLIMDPYAAEVDKKEFTDGWFVKTMPDLNQRNPKMAKYLIQNSIWWIEYAGLGGIRVDTWSYSDKEFLADWTQAILREYPNMNIVGEEWFGLQTVISYWQQGKENHDGYDTYLPSVMDFPLMDNAVKALTEPTSWTSTWTEVYQGISQDFLIPNPMNLLIFPDNHDIDRIFTRVNENFEDWKLAMVLFATMRGIPQFYYGTELLFTNSEPGDHGLIRKDFPGGWDGDEVNGFTGEGLSEMQKDAQAFIKKLYSWRKSATTIHEGKLLHFVPQRDDVYVYFRTTENAKVMVLLNKSDKDATLYAKRFAQGLENYTSGTDVLSGRTISVETSFEVPAKSAMIVELE